MKTSHASYPIDRSRLSLKRKRAAPIVASLICPDPARAAQDQDTKLKVELSFWDSIKESRDPDVFEDYLKKYPDGQFAAIARSKLRALRGPSDAPLSGNSVASSTASDLFGLRRGMTKEEVIGLVGKDAIMEGKVPEDDLVLSRVPQTLQGMDGLYRLMFSPKDGLLNVQATSKITTPKATDKLFIQMLDTLSQTFGKPEASVSYDAIWLHGLPKVFHAIEVKKVQFQGGRTFVQINCQFDGYGEYLDSKKK
jgi:hypothetical protein